MGTDSDIVLLQRYAESGDAEAFEELARRYSGLVYGTCRRLTAGAQDAEDAAQECFLELARKADTIRSSVPGWLHAVATNCARKTIRGMVRRKQREEHAADMEPRGNEPCWEAISPHVDEALESLPEELRAPLVLHYLLGRNQPEIADVLGVNQSTVSRRLEKGIDELRKRLGETGVLASAALLGSLLTANAATAAPVTLTVALGEMVMARAGEVGTAAGAGGVAAEGGGSVTVTTGSVLGTVAGKVAVILLA